MAGEAVDDGTAGVHALATFLKGLKGTIDESSNVSADVSKLLRAFLGQFAGSNDGPAWLRLQADEKFCNAWRRFDDKFCDVMIKLDDAQDAIDAKAGEGGEKDSSLEAGLGRAKREAEDLKPLIDDLSAGLP